MNRSNCREDARLVLFTIMLAALTGLCIHFSDSFYYPGIDHYRSYADLFGAFPASPTHKWPIVFSVGAFVFGTTLALSLILIIRRSFYPNEKWKRSVRVVIVDCSIPSLIGGVLLLHYTFCDFVGDRWYVLNQIYNTDLFSVLKKVYFYLHEITPFLLCLTILWCAVGRNCLSKRMMNFISVGTSLVFSACGWFFLIFDLWFQKWAILPVISGIAAIAITHALFLKCLEKHPD